jgi:hypothetical protein
MASKKIRSFTLDEDNLELWEMLDNKSAFIESMLKGLKIYIDDNKDDVLEGAPTVDRLCHDDTIVNLYKVRINGEIKRLQDFGLDSKLFNCESTRDIILAKTLIEEKER